MSTALYWTLADFDRLVETGFFGRDEKRVELIHGEICTMSPIGADHAFFVDRLAKWSFKENLYLGHEVRVQGPVRMSLMDTELYPDVAWLASKNYRNQHPEPADVLLIIEVASSSLSFDLGEKRDIYASAGIPEYWVVDLEGEKLHLFRKPSASGFEETLVLSKSDSVTPLCAPAATLDVGNLFQ